MRYFSLKNFKILKTKTKFEFKNLTILTGKNNSGKSTLINSLRILSETFNSTIHINGKEINDLENILSTKLNFGTSLKNQGSFKNLISYDSEENNFFFSIDSDLNNFNEKLDILFAIAGNKNIIVDGIIDHITIKNLETSEEIISLKRKKIENSGIPTSFECKINFSFFFKKLQFIINNLNEAKDEISHFDEINNTFLSLEDTKNLQQLILKYNNNIDNIHYNVLNRILLNELNLSKDLIEWMNRLESQIVYLQNKFKINCFIKIKLSDKHFEDLPKNIEHLLEDLETQKKETLTEDYTYIFYIKIKAENYYDDNDRRSVNEFKNTYHNFRGKNHDLPFPFIRILNQFNVNSDRESNTKHNTYLLENKNDYILEREVNNSLINLLSDFLFPISIVSNENTSINSFLKEIIDSKSNIDIKLFEFINRIIEYDNYSFYNISNSVLIKIIHEYVSQVEKAIESFKELSFLSSNRSSQLRLESIYANDDLSKIIRNMLETPIDNFNQRVAYVEKWLKEFQLGEKIEINKNDEQSYSINILKSDNTKFNLFDNGYGLSQILAIILKISGFSEVNSISEKSPVGILQKQKLLIIEEPESNLHPALQSKLADLFCEAIKLFNIKLIIETHSEYLIRKIQFLSSKNIMRPEDTIIYYFYHPNEIEENEKQVNKIHINDDGSLTDSFGTGFFDEADNLAMKLFMSNNQE